jgi:hypothetical protein
VQGSCEKRENKVNGVKSRERGRERERERDVAYM